MLQQPQQEIIFFQDLNATVTSLRVIFGPKVYNLSNLTSVRAAEIPPQKIYPSILMAVGVIILVSGLGQLREGKTSSGLAGIGIALPCIIGAFVWFTLQRPNYAVKLGVYGGEIDGFISENQTYIYSIASAINQALSYRV